MQRTHVTVRANHEVLHGNIYLGTCDDVMNPNHIMLFDDVSDEGRPISIDEIKISEEIVNKEVLARNFTPAAVSLPPPLSQNYTLTDLNFVWVGGDNKESFKTEIDD